MAAFLWSILFKNSVVGHGNALRLPAPKLHRPPPLKRMSSSLDSAKMKFASFDVTNQVFYRSEHSFAIVNLKPIAPGHVLVIPKRTEAKRLKDLCPAEVADLFLSVQQIGDLVESVHKANSLTISIQDGSFAGQSVEHLHVHVIPRRPGDFVPNDAIYNHLNAFEASEVSAKNTRTRPDVKIDNDEREPRTEEDMKQEALMLSQYFSTRANRA
ncbi:hypothetical protein O181_014591 [Austropuccinia psidii MF-1]|uniref:HIT domain-containing protein n=1 Tax=Austropuccinia psidii MF-1 TaxID=1389203 RepID=A0A9Q3C208_9BASI|nr:hypothetical protein [Austropuccinia psidii MF-1]